MEHGILCSVRIAPALRLDWTWQWSTNNGKVGRGHSSVSQSCVDVALRQAPRLDISQIFPVPKVAKPPTSV